MLATNMRRMRTKNVKIRIVGSCCRPKKKGNNNRPFPHSALVSLGEQFDTNHCILPTQASSWCLCLQECGNGQALMSRTFLATF